jgi:hypothetical protein
VSLSGTKSNQLANIYHTQWHITNKLNEAAFLVVIYEICKDFFVPNSQHRINKRKNTKREIIKKAY